MAFFICFKLLCYYHSPSFPIFSIFLSENEATCFRNETESYLQSILNLDPRAKNWLYYSNGKNAPI